MSIELIQGELERLYTLDEMKSLCDDLLGFQSAMIGGTASGASFARALTAHCANADAVAALIDAVTSTRNDASPQLKGYVDDVLRAPVELKVSQELGPFRVIRKLGSGPNGTVYSAKRGDTSVIVKFLHNAALHDKSSVYRFLTRNRLQGAIDCPHLATGVDAGFCDGKAYVCYEATEGKVLAARVGRTGALHLNEARVLLHGVLEALRALHDNKLVHGALKLENVVVAKQKDGPPKVVLVDAGGDLLNSSWVHSDIASSGGNRIKGLAPEQLKGLGSSPRSDMYAFGALLFEVLSGRPPFSASSAVDLAVAHLSAEPDNAAAVAPKGWVSEEMADLCRRLLDKTPGKRPSIDEALDVLGPLKAKKAITDAELEEMVDSLVADPLDAEAAIALELAIEREASPSQVADAFLMAADMVDAEEAAEAAKAGEESAAIGEAKAEAARDRANETKRALLFRAGRLFESKLKAHDRAEGAYRLLLDIAGDDEVAQSGYEGALKAQEKYEELVEYLLDIGENDENHSRRASALNKIGHLSMGPLDDEEQAVIAFAQALANDVQNESFAADLEKAAGDEMTRWAEAMQILHGVTEHPGMPQEARIALFMALGNWYVDKIQRPDLALPCFESVLQIEPAHDGALQGGTDVYRRAQQWSELVAVILSRSELAATPERARDLRAEAATILETRLSDAAAARELYEQTLAEDPGHTKTVEALARIYRRDDDHTGYVKILEQQAEALTGTAKAEAICKIGEIFEDELNDLSEAQRRFEAALEIDAGNLDALRGLDRVLNRSGRYDELLQNLEKQVTLAATPRQRITIYMRIAGIQEEEFLNHNAAAEALESVLAIDANHEDATSSLLRHYRSLDRWDDVIDVYDRALRVTDDTERRVQLLLAQGRVLLDQILSPERARIAYEHVLQLEPDNARALESLAHVRAATGDALAALAAVESLAEKATTPESKAEQWMRAAKILTDHGDRDGAIVRLKQALDAQPENTGASRLLRDAYLARGDAGSAAELLKEELERTEGKLAKARMYQELATLKRERLNDLEGAKHDATKAIDLDPTNALALLLLGDIAFEGEFFVEASAYLGQLSTRIDALPEDDRKRMLMRYIDSLARSGSTEKAQDNVQVLLELAPDDPEALIRAARVRLDADDAKGSAELYATLFEKFTEQLDDTTRGESLYRYGKALRLSDEPDKAIAALNEAADLIPASIKPIDELANAYAAKGNFDEVVRVKQRRLDVAEGDERAKLLLEIGEVYAAELKDATKAAKSFVAALEEKPDDRKVLTRLMKLYSEEKDWSKLVDVVLKLAEGVDEPKQKAKYIHTAAVVSAHHVGDLDNALLYLEQVMSLDPENQRALTEMIDVREQRGDFEEVLNLSELQLERLSEAGDTKELVALLDKLAAIQEEKLGRNEAAVEQLERAQKLDPDNEERAAKLSALYSKDTEKFFDKAIGTQLTQLHKDPYNPVHYRALRKIFTEAKEADPAWCVCQALHVMNCAEPDETRFFHRMRSETSAEAQERVSLEDWVKILTHEQVDPVVSAIFQLVEPAVVAKNAQPLEELGYNPTYALDLANHPYPMSQMLFYAAGVLGFEAPTTFQNPQDPGGISFLHSSPPGIVLGAAALGAEIPTQVGAFIAARHLTYYWPGWYMRHLVPSGTGLRAWLFAAIRLIHEAFPVAESLESTVRMNSEAIKSNITGPNREKLASAVSKLLQGGSIDLKRWVAGVDLSADRAGLLVAHDLEIAVEMIKASDESTASLPHKERIRELTLFSVNPKYFAIRKRLGIGIDS